MTADDASLLGGESTGSVCTLKQENISKVRKAVAQSLKAQFLCQETVPNTETIRKLSQKDLSEIEDEAIKNCVVLRMQAAAGKRDPYELSKNLTFDVLSSHAVQHLLVFKTNVIDFEVLFVDIDYSHILCLKQVLITQLLSSYCTIFILLHIKISTFCTEL